MAITSFFFFNNLFIFLFYFDRAGSSLLCGIFSGCSNWGLFFIAMCWLLIEAAFLIVEHGLSSCGLRAQLLHSMWDLPGPGVEPMSPALAADSLPPSHQGSPPLFLKTEFCLILSPLFLGLQLHVCQTVWYYLTSP